MQCDYSLPFSISAVADAIAANTPDCNELALIAAILTQLGDTLATIVTVREACDAARSKRNGNGNISPLN